MMRKHAIWTSLLALAFLLSGCSGAAAGGSPQPGAPAVTTAAFVSGMGCSDPNCTDASHHHDCPADCADYEHHHNCALDCAEPAHHHGGTHHEESQPVEVPAATPVAFVSGMGCSDPNCTDASHHHDCPADCADYEHHHNCPLDCTDASHHHAAHHEEPHHTAAQPEAVPSVQSQPLQQPATQPEQPVTVQTLSVISYISGMGCSDPNCTDASHHHDCPADCADYEHHHNCALDCAEPAHHHGGAHHEEPQPVEVPVVTPAATPVAFVSGMGCSDPNCTDASHHHDCPADCADYEHHHNCALDCTESSHHHSNMTAAGSSGQHHGSKHHSGHH